jgi:phage tail P2-like protein
MSSTPDMLPPNSTAFERGLSLSTARAGEVPVPIGNLWIAADCPVDLLPWLANALQVDGWESDWTEEQKRASIAAAIKVHKYKGTKAAIVDAVKAVMPDTALTVTEWFEDEPAADPGLFRISISPALSTPLEYRTVLRLVNRCKNVRSHLTGLNTSTELECGLYQAACLHASDNIVLQPL